MSDYKVSVCVPVYNAGEYMRKCAESLLSQSLREVQYIFVNDCTPDHSMEILRSVLERYPDRVGDVTVLENDSNSGPMLSRMRAASLATGEYIYFPDADDWLDPDMLRLLYDKAVADSADLVVCRLLEHHPDGSDRLMPYADIRYSTAEWQRRMPVCQGVYVGLTTTLIRRSVYEQVAPSMPSERLYAMEDYMLATRLHWASTRTVWLDRALYHNEVGNPRSVSKANASRALESKLKVAGYQLQYVKQTPALAEYLPPVRQFCAMMKSQLITSRTLWNPHRWLSLWPELNSATDVGATGFRARFLRRICSCLQRGRYRMAHAWMLAMEAAISIHRTARRLRHGY